MPRRPIPSVRLTISIGEKDHSLTPGSLPDIHHFVSVVITRMVDALLQDGFTITESYRKTADHCGCSVSCIRSHVRKSRNTYTP